MVSNRFKSLRVIVMIILTVLAFQYELGMAVNITNPPAITPIRFSITNVSDALRGVGTVALLHAGLGALLGLISIAGMVMSLGSRVRSVQAFGSLAFLSLWLALAGGLLFVLSGFQNDHNSHQMATGFILTFTFYFLELYFLKPDATKASNS